MRYENFLLVHAITWQITWQNFTCVFGGINIFPKPILDPLRYSDIAKYVAALSGDSLFVSTCDKFNCFRNFDRMESSWRCAKELILSSIDWNIYLGTIMLLFLFPNNNIK